MKYQLSRQSELSHLVAIVLIDALYAIDAAKKFAGELLENQKKAGRYARL